ncbi:MAG: tetratricopeptide repeat protein [Sphingomonadaceae bacterium]
MVGMIGRATMAAVAVTMMVSAVPADAQKKKTPKFTKEVQGLLVKAQEAQQAGNHAEVLQFLDQADAVANKNADDAYMINALRLNTGVATNDNALIERAIEGALASGQVPPEDEQKFIRNLGALAMQRNDYAKALTQFERLLQTNPNDTELLTQIAELQRRQKQPEKAVQTMQQAIQVQETAGQKAPEEWYRRTLAIAYDAKLPAQTNQASLALLKAYPNSTNWRDSLLIFKEGGKFDDQMNLDILRLTRANGALTGERDYIEYAETASARGFPGEAKAVLDEGIAKGALEAGRPVVKELSGIISPKVASDKAALPGLEKEARAAKTGRPALATGDALLGYGQFAKAAEMYKVALSKGGADADTANLRMGFALAQAGDKAGAEAAFKAVTGQRKPLAEYYLAWLGNLA